MLKRRYWPASLVGLTLVAGSCLAQTPEPSKFFKLDFVVKEVEANKVLNTRSYSMTVSTDKSSGHSSLRSGSKVPNANNNSYIDVGVNIDCFAVRELDNELAMVLTAEVNSLPQDPAATALPLMRQNRWTSNVSVPLKRPTIVFSSDDVTSKHQMQLELTATPIK